MINRAERKPPVMKSIAGYFRPPVLPEPYIKDEQDVRFLQLVKPFRTGQPFDVLLLGIPFDGATLGRKGARHAPQAIRRAFQYTSSFNPEYDVDISRLKIADLGDARITNTSIGSAHRLAYRALTLVYAMKKPVIVVGGDHSLTYPSVRALTNTRRGQVGVIVFDTHLDVRTAGGKEPSSGTSFRRLLESKTLRGRNLVEIGAHGYHNSVSYYRYLGLKGARVITVREIRSRGIRGVVGEALERAGGDSDMVYLSVDMDCLDQSFAPGVSAPTPGGLSPDELLAAIHLVAKDSRSVAMDVVEVSPPNDTRELTSSVAASVISHFVGGLVART